MQNICNKIFVSKIDFTRSASFLHGKDLQKKKKVDFPATAPSWTIKGLYYNWFSGTDPYWIIKTFVSKTDLSCVELLAK